MAGELDLVLRDGRTLHVYDSAGPQRSTVDDELAVVWHHGTPNIGAPPAPLFEASARMGVRWLSIDRPGYGGSTPHAGRTIGSVALDTAEMADALGVEGFAVMGHSGDGPHALACAALLPDRVLGAVSVSGLAPLAAEGLDWFGGMSAPGTAALRAAAEGRAAKERYEASAPEEDPGFTAADHAALAGPWAWLGSVVGPALAAGPGGLIDDDLAYVSPWGCEPADVRAPTLLVHGEDDRIVPSSHGQWLAERIPSAELWLSPDDGHLSILGRAEAALEWLVRHSRSTGG